MLCTDPTMTAYLTNLQCSNPVCKSMTSGQGLAYLTLITSGFLSLLQV